MGSPIGRAVTALSLLLQNDRLHVHNDFRVDNNPEGALRPDEVIFAIQRTVLAALSARPEKNATVYNELKASVDRYIDFKGLLNEENNELTAVRARIDRVISCLTRRVLSLGDLKSLVDALSHDVPDFQMSYDFLLQEIFWNLNVGQSADTQWQQATTGFWDRLEQCFPNDGQLQNARWKKEIIRLFYDLRQCGEDLQRETKAASGQRHVPAGLVPIEERMKRMGTIRKGSHPQYVIDALKPLNQARQALYIEHKVLSSLLCLNDYILQLSTAAETGEARGFALELLQDDPGTADVKALRYTPIDRDLTLTELGIQMRVTRMCRKIVRDGVGNDPASTRGISYLLETLIDAKEDGEITDLFTEALIVQMTFNEFLHEYNQQSKLFPLCLENFQQLIRDETRFISVRHGRSTYYRQHYIALLAKMMTTADHETCELPFQTHFKELSNIAKIIKSALESMSSYFLHEDSPQLYSQIFSVLESGARASMAPTKVMASLNKLHLLALQAPGMAAGKGLAYSLPPPDEFSKEHSECTVFWAAGALGKIAGTFHNVMARRANDKQYSSNTNTVAKTAIARSASSVDQGILLEQQVSMPANSMQESTTLLNTPKELSTNDAAPTEAMRKLTLSAEPPRLRQVEKLRYHTRVTRWFSPPGTEEDPFIADANYRQIKDPRGELWERAKHAFALAVDHFLKDGVSNQDRVELKTRNLRAQIQLVGEIHISKGNYARVKRGVFSYSISSRTGQCFHRYFTTASSERIQSEYTQNGHLKIDVIDGDAGQEITENNGTILSQMATFDDGSRVVHETKNIVTIQDPKNCATIKLVKMSQFS